VVLLNPSLPAESPHRFPRLSLCFITFQSFDGCHLFFPSIDECLLREFAYSFSFPAYVAECFQHCFLFPPPNYIVVLPELRRLGMTVLLFRFVALRPFLLLFGPRFIHFLLPQCVRRGVSFLLGDCRLVVLRLVRTYRASCLLFSSSFLLTFFCFISDFCEI